MLWQWWHVSVVCAEPLVDRASGLEVQRAVLEAGRRVTLHSHHWTAIHSRAPFWRSPLVYMSAPELASDEPHWESSALLGKTVMVRRVKVAPDGRTSFEAKVSDTN